MYVRELSRRIRPGSAGPARRTLPLLTAAALLALALGCGPGESAESGGAGEAAGSGAGRAGEDAGSSGPGADDAPARVDATLWVDPQSPAARQVQEWEAAGRTEDARTLRRLAEQPIAEWPSGGEDAGRRIRQVAQAAKQAGQTAVFVAYNVPHRDCGQYSQGGAADVAAYRQWLDAFTDNIEDTSAIVILEPDAVPHIADGCTDEMYHEERFQVLSEAVDRLKELPGTRVYIDAGNPSWITDPGKLAEPLWRSGLARADGFALNVSNYQATDDVIAYGHQLSARMDGAHFVVDTSRNGNGPLDDDGGGENEAWCNPPGRGLGTPPTTDTGDPLVDAYLWIKRAGESDGECRGGPRAGEWWAEYALGLARQAQR
jgi:endoglucanase